MVLPEMAPGRDLDPDPPRALSSGTGQEGSAPGVERGDHGRPVDVRVREAGARHQAGRTQDDRKRSVRGFDGHKRVKGHCPLGMRTVKPYLLVTLWAQRSPAALSRPACRIGVAGLSPLWPTIRIVIADSGHKSRKLAAEIKRREGWKLLIVKRSDGAFKIVGLNWIVERTFA